MTLDSTIEYLVIGDPVAHSRSPQMQNAAFEFYGMGRPYDKLRVDPAKIGDFVDFARKHLKGVNLTVPHKQVVIPFVDELSPQAAVCQSVNTLKITAGKVYGFSTDGAGVSGALLNNFGLSLKGLNVVMLGAGGAATATAFELGWQKCATLTIANRTLAKGEELAQKVREALPGTQICAIALDDREMLSSALKKADLLLQMTSLGLHDGDPAPMPLELLEVNTSLHVFDAIYRSTPLLERARALGLAAADGSDMLIFQGAASFEIWTGKKAPLAEMRRGFNQI